MGIRLRMDEAYIQVKDQWKYYYRAVDKQGKTIDFLLSAESSHFIVQKRQRRRLSINKGYATE